MKNFVGLLLSIVFLASPLNAQQLSDDAEIVVITLGPDKEKLYAAFGHSAFRVVDKTLNIDRVYDYGVFNFNQPNFYLNFLKGHLNYKVGTSQYTRFRNHYIYSNRFIHERVLNLSQPQKQKVFEYLQWNILPENEYYYYDYFYDNCATRIRDVLVTTLGNQLQFDGSYIDTDYTIRELTDLYLTNTPWGNMGIDLCLGLPMDKIATPYMYMFLPSYIESAFDNAYLQNDSTVLSLVKESRVIFEATPTPSSYSFFNPTIVFYSLLLITIVISVFDYKRKKLSKWLDIPLFGIVGLCGLIFLLLWTITDHRAATGNMNLIWAIPTHLIVAIMLFKKTFPSWLRYYFLISFILGTLLLLSWAWLPQLLFPSLIPLVVGLTLRSWLLSGFLNQSFFNVNN